MDGQGAGRQAKQAVVNEVWERGEIVMCITVPDTYILAESNHNSVTGVKPNGFSRQLYPLDAHLFQYIFCKIAIALASVLPVSSFFMEHR